jgi:hypothetical protein
VAREEKAANGSDGVNGENEEKNGISKESENDSETVTPAVPSGISAAEVKRILRSYGQPITLFGEVSTPYLTCTIHRTTPLHITHASLAYYC